MTTAFSSAPMTAAAGAGRSSLSGLKLAPSSALTRTWPAWLTSTRRPASTAPPVSPTWRPVSIFCQVLPPSALRNALPLRPNTTALFALPVIPNSVPWYGSSSARNRPLCASSLSSNPCSPAMYSAPPAGRIA